MLTTIVQPVACYPGELCSGYSSAFACCASSSTSVSNGVSLSQGLNCTQYAPTKCYPSSATKSCTDSACLATAIACSDPLYPECFTAGAKLGYDLAGPVFGKDDGLNLTAVWCEGFSTSLAVENNWLFTYSTSLDSTMSSSTGSLAQTPGSTVPLSMSQAVASSEAAGGGPSQATASQTQDSSAISKRPNGGLMLIVLLAALRGIIFIA